MDQAITEIDKGIMMSKLFSVGMDEILLEDEEIKNLDFTKEALERKTKGYISNLILSFEYIENVEDNITSGLFDYNKVLNDMECVIKKVTLNDVKEVIKCIDTTNKSVLIMKK